MMINAPHPMSAVMRSLFILIATVPVCSVAHIFGLSEDLAHNLASLRGGRACASDDSYLDLDNIRSCSSQNSMQDFYDDHERNVEKTLEFDDEMRKLREDVESEVTQELKDLAKRVKEKKRRKLAKVRQLQLEQQAKEEETRRKAEEVAKIEAERIANEEAERIAREQTESARIAEEESRKLEAARIAKEKEATERIETETLTEETERRQVESGVKVVQDAIVVDDSDSTQVDDSDDMSDEDIQDLTDEIDVDDSTVEEMAVIADVESDYDDFVVLSDDEDDEDERLARIVTSNAKTSIGNAERLSSDNEYKRDISPRSNHSRKRTHDFTSVPSFEAEMLPTLEEHSSELKSFKNLVLAQSAVVSFAVTLIVSCTISLLTVYLMKMLISK